MKTRRYIKWFSSLFFDDCLIEEKKGCKLTIVAKLTSACIPDTPLNIERRHEDRKIASFHSKSIANFLASNRKGSYIY